MAHNFLFMFEFVVDEVIVSKPNKCAPDEYPVCCEVSFRHSVFVSICDHEFGTCIDPCKPKCGKNCLFSLESPINENDKLLIHIYKKKTDQCKFLLGFTEMPVKNIFDKVMADFEIENPNWEDTVTRHANNMPKPNEQKKTKKIVDNDCDSDDEQRREQLCPTAELTKQFLPIFNLKSCQTGNVVLLTRLVAFGPTIVTTFPFSRICSAGCSKNAEICKKCCDPCSEPCDTNLSRCEAGMDNMFRINDGSNPGGSRQNKSNNGCAPLRDPCHKEEKKWVCQRYFACNADKTCPFDEIEDDCARAVKCNEQRRKINCCQTPDMPNSCSCEECVEKCEAEDPCTPPQDLCDPFKCEPCSVETCDDCVIDPCSPCGQCMQPCFQTPRPPLPGPEAFDEFEACLNGSALVIRVLKGTHQVENICDGTEDLNDDNLSECNKYKGKENAKKSNCSLTSMGQRSNVARNHVKRRTGGHIINHPNLPKIRANIKYSGNDYCETEQYHVPYTDIKTFCDNQKNKIDNYRSHRAKRLYENDCAAVCQPIHPKDEKNCCIQVDRQDIRNMMKGLEVDSRKKGIEVCYKTCDDTDSDVFLVKLGSKKKSEHKKNNIEIELKTPKMPVTVAKKHVTTETQINEKELDAALADQCKSRRAKGKKKTKK